MKRFPTVICHNARYLFEWGCTLEDFYVKPGFYFHTSPEQVVLTVFNNALANLHLPSHTDTFLPHTETKHDLCT